MSQILTSFKPANWAQDTVFQLQPTPSPEDDDDESEDAEVPETTPKDSGAQRSPEEMHFAAADSTVVENGSHDNGRSTSASPELAAGQELRHRGGVAKP